MGRLDLDHPIMKDIRKLAAERDHRLAPNMLGTEPLAESAARAALSHLHRRPFRPEAAPPAEENMPRRHVPDPGQMPKQRRFEAIPDGRYAIESLTGNNDLDFFEIRTPSEGRWAGMTFIDRIIGGHEPIAIKDRQTKAKIFAGIRKMGIDASELKFAQELGKCIACNRDLTDKTSRDRGYGPDCWEKKAG